MKLCSSCRLFASVLDKLRDHAWVRQGADIAQLALLLHGNLAQHCIAEQQQQAQQQR